MTRHTQRAPLALSAGQQARLRALAGSRTASLREVERAKILLAYAQGQALAEIQRTVGASRPTIYKCIDKALAAGPEAGLYDRRHRPRAPSLGEEAKAWVRGLARRRPSDLGLAAGLWTLSALAAHVATRAQAAGFPGLAGAGKTTVWRILHEDGPGARPARYCLKQRDPPSRRKTAEVLMLYRDVHLYRAEGAHGAWPLPMYAVDIDEQPAARAAGAKTPAPPPAADQFRCAGRERKQVHHGTLSVLAALDLHTGRIIANVEPHHRGAEFVALLRRLDEHYPGQARIRVVLHHHGAHTSKETMAYLATRPGRFEYVPTPRNGAWLNLVESAFSRMARSFLRHIRGTGLDELRQRILQGIDEMNAQPPRMQWQHPDGRMV